MTKNKPPVLNNDRETDSGVYGNCPKCGHRSSAIKERYIMDDYDENATLILYDFECPKCGHRWELDNC